MRKSLPNDPDAPLYLKQLSSAKEHNYVIALPDHAAAQNSILFGLK
jgi:hypothetical protein